MKKKIKSFWNKRAKNNLLAGSNTVPPDLLETNYIAGMLKNNKSILDVGCGNGIFLKRLSKKVNFKKALGIDYSEQMIVYAKKIKVKKTDFQVLDITIGKDLNSLSEKFDYVITKRSLINLSNFKEQVKVIDNLSKFLKHNGVLICCENSITGLRQINNARKILGLPKIKIPWHNKYFENQKVKNHNFKNLKLVNIHEFSSSFYFCSKVINAYYTRLKNKRVFDQNLNKLAYLIDQNLIPGYSQNVVFEFKRK